MPGEDKRLYESVIGMTSQTHPGAFLHKYREFIVYDRNQALDDAGTDFEVVLVDTDATWREMIQPTFCILL
eukprot:617422-Hanusia_phi.AAC.1